jgi:hypothetical protein
VNGALEPDEETPVTRPRRNGRTTPPTPRPDPGSVELAATADTATGARFDRQGRRFSPLWAGALVPTGGLAAGEGGLAAVAALVVLVAIFAAVVVAAGTGRFRSQLTAGPPVVTAALGVVGASVAGGGWLVAVPVLAVVGAVTAVGANAVANGTFDQAASRRLHP